MSAPTGGEDPLTRTGVLRAEFGENWRTWQWFRRQFTPTSISAIGAILVAAGGYIVHLRESVVQVSERVIVLETKVIPFVQDEAKLGAIDQELAEHAARIARLETSWDNATVQAGTAPSIRRARK